MSGIVLIDEIDLHLHPAWQRMVLPTLSKAFPNLQFIVTSHSPLVASAARAKNIFVTDTAPDGTATIKQIEERSFGRGADQLLLSSYFGLNTARSPQLEEISETLFNNAAKGDADSAIAYLRQLSNPTNGSSELSAEVRSVLASKQASIPEAADKKSASKSKDKVLRKPTKKAKQR